jgi:hypothetical protein
MYVYCRMGMDVKMAPVGGIEESNKAVVIVSSIVVAWPPWDDEYGL